MTINPTQKEGPPMFNNYPPGANMGAYFDDYAKSDKFNAQQDAAITDALNADPHNKADNLGIVFDEDDGENVNDHIYPYMIYYNTDSPDFKTKLTNDLLDHNINQKTIDQLWHDSDDHKISDLLEELLPNSQIFVGQNEIDLEINYQDYYAV